MNLLQIVNKRFKIEISPHKHYLYKDLAEFSNLVQSNSHKIILDIGGGDSPYKSYFYNDKILKYISVDIQFHRNLSVIANAQELPIKSNSVDLVLLIEVLEHIYKTRKALLEINRVLKLNQYLIITVPFLLGKHDSVDYFRFTDDALNLLLKNCGFDIKLIKKRGGSFASIAGLLIRLPYQVFTNILLSILFLIPLLPLIYIFILLDRLDKKKSNTLGYDILAIKTAVMQQAAGDSSKS